MRLRLKIGQKQNPIPNKHDLTTHRIDLEQQRLGSLPVCSTFGSTTVTNFFIIQPLLRLSGVGRLQSRLYKYAYGKRLLRQMFVSR
jgi:hypothetical protein